MSNFSIRIDLLKLKGAFLRELKGKSGTKRCLVIPVDDCDGIFLGEKGCYLNLTAFEMREPRFEDTHCVRAELSREKREQMTEEERKSLPILGGLREIKRRVINQTHSSGLAPSSDFDTSSIEEDLPF